MRRRQVENGRTGAPEVISLGLRHPTTTGEANELGHADSIG